MDISTKNAPRRTIHVRVMRCSLTALQQLPKVQEELHNVGIRHLLVVISVPKLFLQGNPTPQLQQTSCWKFLQLTPIFRKILQRKRPTNALMTLKMAGFLSYWESCL
jgi:hypothetical protein